MAPEWTRALGKDNRGSRPRCVALVDGTRESVAATLTDLVGVPDVVVRPDDHWMPKGRPTRRGAGWDATPAREARLDRDSGFVSDSARRALKDWWLAVARGANTPTWDLASTCRIEGTRGLVLVEAKAHRNELSSAGKSLPGSDNGWKNHARIASAIADGNVGLARASGGEWSLSRDDCYQLSNRFAWSWKLAASGIPVVLGYLGFLDAEDMAGDGPLFRSHDDWVDAVKGHAAGAVDASCWGRQLRVEGVPLLAVIRSRRQALPQ